MKKLLMTLASASLLASATASAQQSSAGPVATPRILMLRMFVGDLDRSEKFYHEVFGTTVAQKMGENVRIANFPGGVMPGIIMIKSKDTTNLHESFVMQVPDLKRALELAAANGGKLMDTNFSQDVGGNAARSSHFTDPDGNVIEVLQIGTPPK